MKVVIAKVDQIFFDGEAQSLTVPASDGQMTILPEHMSIITTLKEGTITLRESGDAEPQEFQIYNGILEVRHDGATIIL